jgi:hypothetical protein
MLVENPLWEPEVQEDLTSTILFGDSSVINLLTEDLRVPFSSAGSSQDSASGVSTSKSDWTF